MFVYHDCLQILALQPQPLFILKTHPISQQILRVVFDAQNQFLLVFYPDCTLDLFHCNLRVISRLILSQPELSKISSRNIAFETQKQILKHCYLLKTVTVRFNDLSVFGRVLSDYRNCYNAPEDLEWLVENSIVQGRDQQNLLLFHHQQLFGLHCLYGYKIHDYIFNHRCVWKKYSDVFASERKTRREEKGAGFDFQKFNLKDLESFVNKQKREEGEKPRQGNAEGSRFEAGDFYKFLGNCYREKFQF